MPLSFALSISHFVSSVGADAGFAALIGLAILVLLYFAHARETSNLRSELLRANERLEELERRDATGVSPSVAPRPPMAAPGTEAEGAGGVAPTGAASSSSAAAAPGSGAGAPPPPGAPSGSSAAVPQPAGSPPAGVGAPPLTDATRVIPGVQEPADSEEAPSDDRQAEAPVAAMPLLAPQGTGAAPSATVAGSEAPPSPASGRAGAPGIGRTPPPVAAPPPGMGRTPAPVTAAAGGNGTSALGASGGQPRSLLEHGLPRRRSLKWLISLVAGLVIVAIAVVLVVVLTSGGNTTGHGAAARHAHSKIAAAPPGISPGAVTVSVVNGTSINQLAHHVGARLTRLGFKEGTLATATGGQTLSATSVGYLPGYHKDGLAVAHALKLPATYVRPAAQSSLSLACPQPTSCTADVVVVAGTDLAPKH